MTIGFYFVNPQYWGDLIKKRAVLYQIYLILGRFLGDEGQRKKRFTD